MVYILMASAFVVVFLIFVIVVWLGWRKKGLSGRDLEYIREHWGGVVEAFDGDEVKAIINADKLLDYALRKRGGAGFSGLSLGEMLKKGGGFFSDINGAWSAHKLRNRYAHEINAKVNKGEAKRALSSFRKALKDLGAKGLT